MCLYPRVYRNKKFEKNKKNGGLVPPVLDTRTLYVPIACGNCMECRKQKSREWQVRLQEDIKKHKNGKFITLTLSNEEYAKLAMEIKGAEGYNLDNEIAIKAMRRFNERWRKKYGVAIRHWTVTELGHKGTENIHLHGILWTNESYATIREIWKYGYIYPRPDQERKTWVNNVTISYMTKYVSKMDMQHKTYKSKILTSNGIGGNYTERETNIRRNKYNGENTEETYRTETGHRMKLPIYWRNKIYSEEEREQLWIMKLDKEERWVNGVRIDISKGEEKYFKVLELARKANAELGYGNNQKDWNRQEYEHQRREIIIRKRIEDGMKNFIHQWKPMTIAWTVENINTIRTKKKDYR